ILAGEDFAELARVYSEDILSAAMGGDLGFIEKDDFDERFGEAVSHLKRGEVSDVVTSAYGYHVIQLIDRREPIGKP
ncbi:MAG: peptidylprolyl isomerase, partial [Candidatus Hydrogenedentes bacterium]|nr:peptidylprolyl isomerase [Candidatus Hydrogenedentota bacterium]